MPQYDDRIHHAHVVTSDSSTGKITVNLPGKFGNSETVDVSFTGRKEHDANNKWLVPAAGDSIIVCQEDEDCTDGVFWLNTKVPPDPPYTFVDTPGVDGDKTTHFGTMLQVETGNTGQVRVNTSTNVGGAALVVQPWGTLGIGLYVNHTSDSTTNRAAIQLGSSLRMGTGSTTSTLGDWFVYDEAADKFNLYHSGHSNVANGGLTVRATGTHTLGTAGTFERYIQFAPTYDWSGYERGGIFINNQYSDFTFFGTVYQYSCHPAGNNAYSLGYSGGRWSEVFAVNGTINTSDENQKTDIADSDLGLDFVNALRPVKFKWTETEGRAGVRTHYGLLGQEVETVLGGAASDTAIWTNALIEAHPAMAGDPERNVIAVSAVEEHYEQGLRYTELIAPIIKAIQELTTRLAALESA